MRLLVKLALFLAVVGGLGTFGYNPAINYWRERNKPIWETKKVVRGDAVESVTATGTVKPVLSISVGAFVSGPVIELLVDFNDEVQKDQLLARIDPRLFRANVARDQAMLATRRAEVARAKSQLQQALNAKQRGERLRATNPDFLSDGEMEGLQFDCEALEAQLLIAEASVLQAEAGLENSNANLQYTEIRAPMAGVIIDRKIDAGQTLAAQFQTPELFTIAPDLQKKVYIYASVAEKEIGIIQQAHRELRPVSFTVDAYPELLFEGAIEQIRVSSEDVQGVVSYPVVIAAANPERKLLPGMTASISFEVATQAAALKIPNDAIRFYPEDIQYVRQQDHELLDASRWKTAEETSHVGQLTANEKVHAQKERNRRHVWVEAGGLLRAVEVVTGISESRYTVLTEGDLQEGDALVVNKKRVP